MEAIMAKDTVKEETQNVPTPMDRDLLGKLDFMVEKQSQTRAGFIRFLVKQAWEELQRDEKHRNNLIDATRKAKAAK